MKQLEFGHIDMMSGEEEIEQTDSSLPARTRARKMLVQYLYAVDVRDDTSLDLSAYLENEDLSDHNREFVKELAPRILEQREEIDQQIRAHSENWELDRMSVVDRNLLRLGIAEITFDQETPRTVVINECVELAKRMSSDESHKFVNAILDRVD